MSIPSTLVQRNDRTLGKYVYESVEGMKRVNVALLWLRRNSNANAVQYLSYGRPFFAAAVALRERRSPQTSSRGNWRFGGARNRWRAAFFSLDGKTKIRSIVCDALLLKRETNYELTFYLRKEMVIFIQQGLVAVEERIIPSKIQKDMTRGEFRYTPSGDKFRNFQQSI